IGDWQIEWKWDGIRSQLIQRNGQTFIWSRGEELVTERYPELRALGPLLPDGTVVDGEILPFGASGAMPFAQLQRRIGRKTLGKKTLTEVPVILLAYDLIEFGAQDIRSQPMAERRSQLAKLVATVNNRNLQLSELVEADSWEALASIR